MSILEKKDFEYISVKEICEAAGVNRSTFYLHYENTRDLLEESIKYMHERFLSYFSTDGRKFIERISVCPRDELMLITPEYLAPYLTYIKDHRRLYATAMRNPSSFYADRTYENMFRNVFDPILSRFSVPVGDREYIMSFYLNGITALVSEWLKNDCSDSVERMISIIETCIVPVYQKGP